MGKEEAQEARGGTAQASPLTVAVPAATGEATSQGPILRVEDFTDDPIPSGGLDPPEVRPYDPAPARERVRSLTALILVATLLLTILLSFGTIWFSSAEDRLIDLLTLIYAPLVGLVGAVAGFYYGTKERS